jgi:flagellar biosynthesis protein FlhB
VCLLLIWWIFPFHNIRISSTFSAFTEERTQAITCAAEQQYGHVVVVAVAVAVVIATVCVVIVAAAVVLQSPVMHLLNYLTL